MPITLIDTLKQANRAANVNSSSFFHMLESIDVNFRVTGVQTDAIDPHTGSAAATGERWVVTDYSARSTSYFDNLTCADGDIVERTGTNTWVTLVDVSNTLPANDLNDTNEGILVYAKDKNLFYFYNGTSWVAIGEVMTGAVDDDPDVAGAAGLVPAPAADEYGKFLRGDGTWATVSGSGGSVTGFTYTAATAALLLTNSDTTSITATVATMAPATTGPDAAGEKGLVPKPAAGDDDKFLTGAATWVAVSDGDDGLGWTGGAYNAGTGVVTFSSDDALGFTTGDLRGASGLGWKALGTGYDAGTGVVTFASDDGLGFTTGDLRGATHDAVTLASVTGNYLTKDSAQEITAGTVPITLGGTGAINATAARAALGAGTGDGAVSFNGTTVNGLVTYASPSTGDVEANLQYDGSFLKVGHSAASSGNVEGVVISGAKTFVSQNASGEDNLTIETSGRITTRAGIRSYGNSFLMGPMGHTVADGTYPTYLTDGTNSPARGTLNFIANEGVATKINKGGGYSSGVTDIVVDDANGIFAGQSITLLHTDKTTTENREVASVNYDTDTVTLTAVTTNAYPDNSYVDVWGTSNLNFRNANDNSDLQFDYAETGGILKFRSRTSKQNASHAGGSATSTTRFEMDGDGAAKFNAALTHPCTPSRKTGTVALNSTDRVVWVDPGGAGKVITLPSWTHGRVIDIYYGKTDGTEPFTVTPYLDESAKVTDVGYAGDALNGTQRVENTAGVAEVSRLTLGDPSLLTGDMGFSSDFYLIRDGNSGGPGKKYIWLKVSDDEGVSWTTDPLGLVNSVQSGHLSDDGVEVEVNRAAITTAGQLASAIATAVNGYASFAAVVENTNEVKITNATAGAASPNIRMRAGQSSETMADPSYTGYDETVDTGGADAQGSTTTTPTVTITAPVGSGVRFVAIRQESEGGAGDSDMNIWVASTITGATVSS